MFVKKAFSYYIFMFFIPNIYRDYWHKMGKKCFLTVLGKAT